MYNYYGNLDVVLKSFIENQTNDNLSMQIHVMIKKKFDKNCHSLKQRKGKIGF